MHPRFVLRIDRLNTLIDALERFHEREARGDKFDIEVYASELTDGDDHPCGTACCALGLAGLLPEFNALGLWTLPDYGYVTLTEPGADRPDHRLRPSRTAFEVGEQIFGMTYTESLNFYASHYQGELAGRADDDRPVEVTPAMVAARLRQVIADRRANGGPVREAADE